MKVMVFVKATPETEAGVLPTTEEFIEMGKYNKELVEAGIVLGGEGIKPSSAGARIHFSGTKRTVVDGPFTEAKELVAGFWIWQVKSLDEAIEWAKRFPNSSGASVVLELRPLFGPDDFAASDPTGELRAEDERLRAQAASKLSV